MLENLVWVKFKPLDQSEIIGDHTGKTSWGQIIHGLQNQVKGFELYLANKSVLQNGNDYFGTVFRMTRRRQSP